MTSPLSRLTAILARAAGIPDPTPLTMGGEVELELTVGDLRWLVDRLNSQPIWVMRAALRRADGCVVSMDRPARHGDLMRAFGFCGDGPDGQGFILSDGSYATREEAWTVAQAAHQPILRRSEVQAGEYLFSEDLW